MKFFNKKNIIFFLVFGLVIFLSYRFYQIKWLGYERIPDTNIFDERDYSFVGYTFRHTGIPTGWSVMDVYETLSKNKSRGAVGFNGTSITIDNQMPSLFNINKFNYPVTYITDIDIGKGTETIKLMQPFLDHPIFGSIVFSLGIKSNITSFNNLYPAEYRQMSLYISVITGILIFIFSFTLYKNILISFLSFFIYSTIPTFVLMSRFALFENILIPLFLLSFCLILWSLKIKDNIKSNLLLLLSGLIAGLGFITKVSGTFIILALLIVLLKNKSKFKKYLIVLTPFLLISVIYYTYTYLLAPELCFKLLFDQANRSFFGPLNFFYSIVQPNFKNFPKEGYWIFGLISLVAISYKNFNKHFYLVLGFLCYLFVFLFLGGVNYAWYHIPFLPFLIIASAYFLYKFLVKPNLISLCLFYLLPFSSSFYWGYFTFKNTTSNYPLYRLSLIFFIGLFLINKYFKFKIKIFNKEIYLGQLIWTICICAVFWQIYKWNIQGFQYITANWGKLPEIFTVSDKLF